jgi:hypothetical protein
MGPGAVGYVWRAAALAVGVGLAVGGLTALFMLAGMPPGAAPVLAMGAVFPPTLLAIQRLKRSLTQPRG